MSTEGEREWVCVEHQESTRHVCPCIGFDGRCHECPDPTRRPPCQEESR